MSNQVVFLPEVLGRIAPDVALQRHLRLGIRPSLRTFDEFRTLQTAAGLLARLAGSVVGSATVKQGATHVFCAVTVGLGEASPQHGPGSGAPVYPVVEIARGRLGAPSDEEQLVSQQLYNHVLTLGLVDPRSLLTALGHAVDGAVVYPDSEPRNQYVLLASIKVFSRQGPLFDVAHHALVRALGNTMLPNVYVAEGDNDPGVRVPVRLRGHFGHVSQLLAPVCVDTRAAPRPLGLRGPGVSSLFGLVALDAGVALLADLEGDAEELCAESRITVVATPQRLSHVSIAGGGATVTVDLIRRAVRTAQARAAHYAGTGPL